MNIGVTSFGFRHLLLDQSGVPSLLSVVKRARALGFDALQICENARPMALGEAQWQEVVREAAEAGLEIQLGCKTVDLDVLRAYAGRAACLPGRLLRVVLERDDGPLITGEDVKNFLAGAWPILALYDLRLAIENHYDLPSRLLVQAVGPYSARRVGFCVDTANSLRNFESPELVMELLGERAFSYHLKDFVVEGDRLGFRVGGACLGEGHLHLDVILDAILARHERPRIYIEHWRWGIGNRETDLREDEDWLRRSLEVLRGRLRVAQASRLLRCQRPAPIPVRETPALHESE
jgi:sugar phosphate isomerase/epimerase